jgi:hypothetical protein
LVLIKQAYPLQGGLENEEDMSMSHNQNVGQNYSIQSANRFFKKKVQVFGNGSNNQNLINEEIKSKLNSWGVCYNQVQNILSSRMASKNIKVKRYQTNNFALSLHGYETWSLY